MDFLFSSDPFSSIVKSSTTFLDRNKMWHGGCFVLSDDMINGDLKCRYNMTMEGIEMKYVFHERKKKEWKCKNEWKGHEHILCSLSDWEICKNSHLNVS